ncbi:enolase C-terminal domain-like protein [Phytomonospora endophytica]|uniref:Mannonate dehydratase n=1 Tax=Phytomonospora endophytica TaxID=714109 RepID=A0A841FX01_9ACTN|nr:enolase C-terminal domain-like protein [Phytomonospora endophytica]MBB6037877.1 mannonate dehydratase [Phytomonospora endophytica]GIG68776.1 D-mannonate dehydratase CC2812 [Phytomonospora endophytica]
MSIETFANPWPAREDITITSVRAITTAPEGIALVVVRIDTNVPGLYGLGCATFTQRWKAVVAFVNDHLARLLIGRYPGDIGDLTRLAGYSGYWRGGPVTNNAISGIDQALWDIAGKRAGMPVHELLGGKVRAAADTYLHASGRTIEETIDQAQELAESGLRHIRLQVSTPGGGGYGAPQVPTEYPDAPYRDGWSSRDYLRRTPALFEAARDKLPGNLELLHDVHSRLSPKEAVWLARALEPYRLFFLEDVLAPEHWDRLPEVRAASPVPLAVGELTTSLQDAVRLVRDHGVDFIRSHVSDIGGLTPARKIADLADLCGVKTAWHGPGDTSPIGAAANVALDVTSAAFGIQEGHVYSEATHEVFPGTLRITNGWLHPNEAPGWGIDIDEAAAARYPAELSGHDAWAAGVRRIDGALEAP